MPSSQPRVISVRGGRVRPSGSWLYVWLDSTTGDIVHVGGTGFDPELRAHLHLTGDNPQLGRVRATVPRSSERDFDVLAFELSARIDRPRAKEALTLRLLDSFNEVEHREQPSSEMSELIDSIAQEVEKYVDSVPGSTDG